MPEVMPGDDPRPTPPPSVVQVPLPNGQPSVTLIRERDREVPTMGISGLAKSIAGVSILAVFVSIYIFDRHDARDTFKEMIKDLKESNRDDRKAQTDVASRAHEQFQAVSGKQWEGVNKAIDRVDKNTETVKGLTDEVRKGNTEVQLKLTTLIEEVKKSKANGGGP